MKNVLSQSFNIKNGTSIPAIGLGTWQIPEGEVCYNAVRAALDAGYTHIDTAFAYGNEKSVKLSATAVSTVKKSTSLQKFRRK